MGKNDDQRKALGAEAERIWHSPMVQGFMKHYVEKLLLDWSVEEDEARRNELWYEQKAVGAFKDHFLRYITDSRTVERKQEGGGVMDTVGPII